MRTILFLSAIAVTSFVTAQNVTIPDPNFKAYLVGNTAINTNGDTEISVAEAQAFTGTIDCNSLNISDLTGIEAFVNIGELSCYNNQLTSLNVSTLTQLEELSCHTNQLTELDVSSNATLKYLYCANNQLTTLDVSNNTQLLELFCPNNQLTSLNLKNGNNIFASQNDGDLDLKNNSLRCIQVDDQAFSDANWSDIKDVAACFSENCVTPVFSDLPSDVEVDSSVSLPTESDNTIIGVWSPATVDTSVAGSQTYTFTPDSCANVFKIQITVTLNRNNFDVFGFSYYPNPVNNMLHFSANQPIENVVVSNILGQQVKVNLSSDNTNVDVSSLSAGNYFVKATIEGVSKTFKIIKK